MMKRAAFTLALGTGLLAAALAAAAASGQRAVDPLAMRTEAGRTLLVRAADAAAAPDTLVRLVPLPPDATRWSVRLLSGDGAVAGDGRLRRLRGLPAALVTTVGLTPGAEVAVDHDGSWYAAADDRFRARAFDAAIAAAWGLPAEVAGTASGAYVVIAPPAYAAAAAPLISWKRAKGLDVVLATTDETGAGNAEIRDWLRAAYAGWDVPPEYVLILGDVEQVPSWNLSQNVTDLPYAFMDDGDWLPDLMVGRLPAATDYEARTMVNRTVAYESAPYRDDAGWFTRQLMVGANYSSETPVSTVTWCGEQMRTLGFDAPATVFYPPLFNGVFPITQALETGVSLVVYRGWAYGTAGWEPPHFTVENIPDVDNGAMDPVVMSFVCLNGNFAADEGCFGEAFLRQGGPDVRKGAVAFIGNGEHWSHTRYNDAMAISFFEEIVDPGIEDLGALMLAGKLRFLSYFPHELSYAEHGEESVEFYFHIYNLLGDPELQFWKGPAADLDARHDANCPPAASRFDVTVREADGETPLAGARVGLTQGGALVGSGFSGTDGVARVAVSGLVAGEPLALTVTAVNRFPALDTLTVAQPAAHLAVTGWTLAEESGNGDGAANPGETLRLYPTIANDGEATATGATLAAAVDGPAGIAHADFALPDIAGGATYQCGGEEYVRLDLAPTVDDGTVLRCDFDLSHAAAVDRSERTLTVGGPTLAIADLSVGADGVLRQGEDNPLVLTLANRGGLPFPGGTAVLELLTPGTGAVGVRDVDVPAIAAGQTATLASAHTLAIDVGVPTGREVALRFVVSAEEPDAYEADLSATLVAGEVDPGAPTRPDRHGYRALDSADAIEYPDLAPAYRWTHLTPALGGNGEPVAFVTDNAYAAVDLPFPFTFYGTTYAGAIRVSEDGWISFDLDDALAFYNWPLPSPHGNGALIAPFWDNFDPTLPGTGGVFTLYDAGAGTFTIEWRGMRHYQPEIDDAQTFQLVLFDPAVHPTPSGDGRILFLYRQALNVDYLRQYATIGIESPDETDGLQLSYAGLDLPGAAPVGPGLAVLLTTEVPVRVPYTATLRAERDGAGVRLSWRPDDARPVTCWSVQRIDADGATATLTPAPLAADAREWVDAGPVDAAAVYRLVARHPYGHTTVAATAAVAPATAAANALTLSPCLPNPARGAATFAFALPRAGRATLRVYDLGGRLVRTLVDGERPAGPGAAIWDGRDAAGREAAAGLYVYRLVSGGEALTRKFLLVR